MTTCHLPLVTDRWRSTWARAGRTRRSWKAILGFARASSQCRCAGAVWPELHRVVDRRRRRNTVADALDLAYRCGARVLIEQTSVELRAAGARPRRVMRRRLEALTPSELRVTQMAADGATNREIAQELFVTLKTVEGHLAHAYLKLGLSGRGARAELGQVLAGERP